MRSIINQFIFFRLHHVPQGLLHHSQMQQTLHLQKLKALL